MFNTPTQIQQALADTLQLAGTSSLTAYLIDLCTPGQAWAYNQIVAMLGARGWLLATIVQWDLGATAEAELACFRVMTRAGSLLQVDDKLLKSLDWREELKTIELTIAGVWTPPDGTAGQIQQGARDGIPGPDYPLPDRDGPAFGCGPNGW